MCCSFFLEIHQRIPLFRITDSRSTIHSFIHSFYKMLTISYSALTALMLAPMAFAAVTPNMSLNKRALNSGEGTWYGENCGEEACWQDGACAFTDYTLPSSVLGSTCVSEAIWDNGANCGGCVSISYKGGAKKIAMACDNSGVATCSELC